MGQPPHGHLLTGLPLLLTAGAVPADTTSRSGNSSRYAHRGMPFSCLHTCTLPLSLSHTNICLPASRCSLQLGQYLQTPPHAQATVPGMHTEACRHHLTLRQQFKVCAQGYAVFMLAHMHTPPLSLSHRHLLTGLLLLLTAGAVPADITPCSGNSSRYAHRGKLFARSCTHARTQAHTHTPHLQLHTPHSHIPTSHAQNCQPSTRLSVAKSDFKCSNLILGVVYVVLLCNLISWKHAPEQLSSRIGCRVCTAKEFVKCFCLNYVQML